MADQYILPLRTNPAAAIEDAGGKAHNLMRLAEAGMPVPEGFVVTTGGYREWSIGNGLMPSDVGEEISREYDALGVDCAVAVRSSATAEDLRDASFAGGQESVLNVSGREAVLAAVLRCWASLQGDRVRAYRSRMGVSEDGLGIAVIVQRMVRARTSGVIFTAEPVTGDRNTLAIDACPGLGEALVSGQITPEHFELRKQGFQVRKHENRAGYLTKAEIRKVAQHALEIERQFGEPQDIEWSLDDQGRLHILQSRPITTLYDTAAWRSPVPGAIWVRRGGGGLPEYLPTALSPLYATAQLPRIVALHDAQCPEMGVLTPAPTMAVINGHYYSRQDYKLGFGALLLPLNYWRAGRKAAPWWKEQVLPAQTAALAGLRNFDRKGATDRELLIQLDRILEFNAIAWDNAVRASRAWVVLEPVFKRIFQTFVRPLAGGDAVAFLRGFESQVFHAEQAQYQLVQSALANPEVGGTIRVSDTGALRELQRSPEGRQWLGQLLGFCERFGHMTPNQDYLWATAADDPALALATVRARLDLPASDPSVRQERVGAERESTERLVFEKLKSHPLRRRIFAWALSWAREGASIREDVFFHALAGWPLARRTMLEFGTRFAERGVLDREEHVFFLEWRELAALAAGMMNPQTHTRVEERMAAFDRQKELSAPPMIPMEGAPRTISRRIKHVLKRMVVGSSREDRGNCLHGSPVSPGCVTGPARILASASDFGRLQAGDIVVTRSATPDWTPTFTVAAGLVTDTGGPLSHCSIIAREFGIPAVMGVQTATKRIMEGQMITVDGGEGVIRLHAIEVKA
ncbi:MAG: PEP-utilizing enzyme [Acidobacteriota bacterium]|nr:PEP-utilizing enzyme [Acidobacteriota bacterium]